jgi:hypothetical protein
LDSNSQKHKTEELAILKEDISRKVKLISSLKANKASDFIVIEQWKSESLKLEEKCKRSKCCAFYTLSLIKFE